MKFNAPVASLDAASERDVFVAALEHTSPTARAAFLQEVCADAPAVRARVEALLAAAEDANGFLDMPDSVAERDGPGMRIDRYRLVERIGEGGFGVVYRAEQERPVRRTVALKIIKLGMDTRAVVARFEAERQALAVMDHPNIARVFDGGATAGGRPYFVMEFVEGVPLTAFCNAQRLRLRERLELFLQVCDAVQHAHQKGIIHRDLKPSNLLVAHQGDRVVAKVIDFGIAKATREPLTAATMLTRPDVLLGTPAYMSPEQVAHGSIDVDTRADIYSLGAVLYELLADVPALDVRSLLAGGYAAVQRAIAEREPPPPSQRVTALARADRDLAAGRRHSTAERLVSDLRGDLDRIVLKCLEKDRARRYGTTEELARDIMRYLRHEPVHARGVTLGYRAIKFTRRHRAGVVAAAIAVGLSLGMGFWHTQRLATERDRAQAEARKTAKVSELLTELLAAGDPFRTPTAQGTLETSAARVHEEFAAEPEVRAEILNAVGRVHLRRGEHAKALPVLTEALAAARLIGRPDLRLAQALSHLGVLRGEMGDPAGGVPLVAEALTLRRTLRGTAHNDVAISLVELGRLHSALERFDLAEPLFREALEIRRAVLGPEHREVAVSLGDLAVVLWQQGELAAAEPLFVASLAMHRRTLGPDHPNVAQGMANLAQLRIDQGQLTNAEQLLREAQALMARSFGAAHWRTARIQGHLSAVYRAQQRLDEAATLAGQALDFARTALGADRPLVATLAVERAQVHLAQREPAAAAALLREAWRVQRLTLPEDGWKVAATKALLGAALLELGELHEAEALLAAASLRLRDIPGPQGRETAATFTRLAAVRGETRPASLR